MQAPKRWIEYIDILETFRPRRFQNIEALHELMLRESPAAVQASSATFRRVLNGNRPARPGFAAALMRIYGLQDLGVTMEDFEAEPGGLASKLDRTPTPSAFADLLHKAADGTQIELRALEHREAYAKHFGASANPQEQILRPGVTYRLEIRRPEDGIGTAGHVCLLGCGIDDGRWQLVSARANVPVHPDKVVQWGRMTAIELTPSEQSGRHVLHALGSRRSFGPALRAIYERELQRTQTDGFMRSADVEEIRDIVRDSIEAGAWAASLSYRVQTF